MKTGRRASTRETYNRKREKYWHGLCLLFLICNSLFIALNLKQWSQFILSFFILRRLLRGIVANKLLYYRTKTVLDVLVTFFPCEVTTGFWQELKALCYTHRLFRTVVSLFYNTFPMQNHLQRIHLWNIVLGSDNRLTYLSTNYSLTDQIYKRDLALNKHTTVDRPWNKTINQPKLSTKCCLKF